MKQLTLLDMTPDPVARRNFRLIEDQINGDTLLKGHFQFFKFVFTAAVTAMKIPHKLGFRPLDVILTSVSAGATVTWAYDTFDATNVVITTSGACVVRCFLGAYAET